MLLPAALGGAKKVMGALQTVNTLNQAMDQGHGVQAAMGAASGAIDNAQKEERLAMQEKQAKAKEDLKAQAYDWLGTVKGKKGVEPPPTKEPPPAKEPSLLKTPPPFQIQPLSRARPLILTR